MSAADLVMEALRAAGEPVREVVLHERVLALGGSTEPDDFIDLLERLGTEGHVRMTVEHDTAARDPEPFGPRYWSIVR